MSYEQIAQRGFEAAVELDHVHVSGSLGEPLGQHPEAAADLEHHVLAGQLREPLDHVEDVAVDEEVLPQLLSPSEDCGSGGFDRALELAVGDPPLDRERPGGIDDARRFVRLAADRLRCQVGRIGLDQQPA